MLNPEVARGTATTAREALDLRIVALEWWNWSRGDDREHL
jgi:hypothetical protein